MCHEFACARLHALSYRLWTIELRIASKVGLGGPMPKHKLEWQCRALTGAAAGVVAMFDHRAQQQLGVPDEIQS